MAVQCPGCKFVMNIKGARPGRFTPECPQCHQRFILKVSEDPNVEPEAKAIPKPKPIARDGMTAEIAAALGIEVSKGKPKHRARPVPAGDESADRLKLSSSGSGMSIVLPSESTAGAPALMSDSSLVGASRITDTTPPPASPAKPNGQVALPASDIDFDLSDSSLEPPREEPPRSVPPAAPIPAAEPSPAPHAAGEAIDKRSLPETSVPGAPAPKLRRPPSDAPVEEDPPPARSLGGYEIIQKIGAGGMGAVYLARQVSLDRNVAVKVLPNRFAADPQFVARFTREAFAAAQLNHHNVVQIHDIGAQKGTHFFSMEFVEGQTLADLVEKNGKIDPEAAATYVLQAARGLKHAHERGMVHRDIKPENLMLNAHGVVKVADLGLVKTSENEEPGAISPGGANATSRANVTQASIAMGTPAYMAPEQCVDAAKVDHRADIYSLGCTLYDLLTGRPPFEGKTAIEVMTKHQREPAVPPERLVKHIPPTLSAILMKMMAKKPDNRYGTMDSVIGALESFLGVDSSKPFSPREEHVRIIEIAAEQFAASQWAKIRRWTIRVFFLASLLAIVLCAGVSDRTALAGGLVGLAVLTAVSYVIVQGISEGTHVFRRLRQLVFGASLIDWLIWLALGAGLVWALVSFKLHLWWGGFALAAVLLACAFHFTIDLFMKKERAIFVQQAEALLRQMRLKGLEETALRHFVCKYAGERWEEFYESLFGYEAKLVARTKWGQADRGKDRPKHAAWRDTLISWIDHKQQARKEARERKHLQQVEARSLEATGVDPMEARAKAKKRAERMVDHASEVYESKQRGEDLAPPRTEMKTRPGGAMTSEAYLKSFADDDHEDKKEKKRERGSQFARRYGNPVEIAFGQHVRVLLALVVLAGFIAWQKQNASIYAQQGADLIGTSEDPVDIANQKKIDAVKMQTKDFGDISRPWRPLVWTSVAPVPAEVLKKFESEKEQIKVAPQNLDFRTRWLALLGTWNALFAAVVLGMSCMWASPKVGFAVLVAAGLTLFGHFLPLPMAGTLDPWQMVFLNINTAIAGAAVAFVAIFFLRDTITA